jgi:hypothetical protein
MLQEPGAEGCAAMLGCLTCIARHSTRTHSYSQPSRSYSMSAFFYVRSSRRITISLLDPDAKVHGSPQCYESRSSWIRINVWLAGSGVRRAKMTHKNNGENEEFHVLKCSLLRAEAFSCCLDVLHGGLGMDSDPLENQCGSTSLDSHLVRLPIPICEAPMQIRIKAPNEVVA